MSFTHINDPEAAERLEQHLPQRTVLDPISSALGASVFVAKHRLDLHIETPLGRSPRLYVSRYYWDLDPPVAVDFVREIQYAAKEVAVKRAFCRERNIRYILCASEFDEEAITGSPMTPPEETPSSSGAPQKPVTAPRRRNPSKRR